MMFMGYPDHVNEATWRRAKVVIVQVIIGKAGPNDRAEKPFITSNTKQSLRLDGGVND